MDFDLYAQEVAAATSQSQVQGALIDLKVTITSAAMLGKKEAVYNALHKLPKGLTESLEEHRIELLIVKHDMMAQSITVSTSARWGVSHDSHHSGCRIQLACWPLWLEERIRLGGVVDDAKCVGASEDYPS